MGESDHPAFGPPASLSGQQLYHSSGICPQIQGLHCGAYLGEIEEMVWVLQRGHSVDGCDLRVGDLSALSWARVRRVRWGSISSELLMCGGGVHSILLVARCLETIDVCIWRMFVLMSVILIVTVWGSVGMFVV